jgi:hypothetical protein
VSGSAHEWQGDPDVVARNPAAQRRCPAPGRATFLRALLTLDALPEPDTDLFRVRSWWPPTPRAWSVYSPDPDDEPEMFVPTPHDLEIMLDVLALGHNLDRQQWLIARDVAEGYSRRATAERLHLTIAQINQRYEAALDVVYEAH